MVDNSTLPGCIGYFGHAIAPNGPCERCGYARLCRHVKLNFVPKAKLQPILAKLEEVERKLKGG
jgi:hypothetical protein